jgi:phosphatidylglycerophosphate synthase
MEFACHRGQVIDRQLRAAKDRLIEPFIEHLPRILGAATLTTAAAVAGVAAGLLAAADRRWWALSAWLFGRLLDIVDGTVARRTGRQSDLGGYLDLMGDTVAYAAVPLGIAAAHGEREVWAACAVLLATFYLNTVSWTFLAAVAEKRGAGATARGESTTVHMPAGLVEGAETIVLYTVMLVIPAQAEVLFWAMAALVVVTVLQRVVWAMRGLR